MGDTVTNHTSAHTFFCNFDRISLSGSGDLIITQGEQESLTVEADDNIMQYVRSDVSNRTLFLGFTPAARRKNIRPTVPIAFILSLKEVSGLELSGSGTVTAEKLTTDHLSIEISGFGRVHIGTFTAEGLVLRVSGSGDFELAGKVVKQDVRMDGKANYRAGKLESETAAVEVRGWCDAAVWATDSLDVQISGRGSVKYYGNPRVTQEISGSGSVRSLGNP